MLNPVTTNPDFFGTPGACLISVGITILVNVAYFACNEDGCPAGLQTIASRWASTALISWPAFTAYSAWVAALIALDRLVPGLEWSGIKRRDGTTLRYKFNGSSVVALLAAVLIGRIYHTSGAMPELVFVYDNLLQLTNSAVLYAVVLSTIVYAASFRSTDHSTKKPVLLAEGGNTGSPLFDWYIGRELDPRIGSFDVKVFCEMRPGLLLWVVINLAMMHHQWLRFGLVTDSMWLAAGMQIYYVVEGTFYETGLVSMMDVTTDGFGYMLCFGDLALVPFTYTLQTRFLADHPERLGLAGSAVVLAVFLTGLVLFRMPNNQKNAFRAGHPSASSMRYIESPQGSRLLVSGFYSRARHLNYFGDWIIGLAYCMATGLHTPVTYYYVFFFAALLLHRETRDEAKCAAKYGPFWDQYKHIVRWRIVPFVY